jgi:hypothetical protein
MKTYHPNAFAGVLPNTLNQRRIIFLFCLLSLSILAFSNNNNNSNVRGNLAMNSVDTAVEFSLPLVMTSFTAVLSSSKEVKLEWVTGMEKDLSHFVVERSVDGKEYKAAGKITAAGNSGAKRVYAFTDILKNVERKTVYYRLKMIDIENRYQNSQIRTIKLSAGAISGAQMTAYPNPVIDELKVTIPSAWQRKQVSYDVYNTNGILVKHITTGAASQTEIVNLQGFGAGMYIVKASTESESLMQRIVKK